MGTLIEFHLEDCAINHAAKQRLREYTRHAAYCWAMRSMGYHAAITTTSKHFVSSDRWKYFRHLFRPDLFEQGNVAIVPIESAAYHDHRNRYYINGERHKRWKAIVGVKNSKKGNDADLLKYCDVLVAHEYNHEGRDVENHPGLLPVPWIVHDRMLQFFSEKELLPLYLGNKLQSIRDYFKIKKTKPAGFMGYQENGRRAMAAQMPDWIDFVWRDGTNGIGIRAYIEWLLQHKAGVHFPGDTPKANRFSELALLGLAIITVDCGMRDTPPITSDNTILLKDWNDHQTLEEGMKRIDEIVVNADRDYINGWSSYGQAKLMIAKVNELKPGLISK